MREKSTRATRRAFLAAMIGAPAAAFAVMAVGLSLQPPAPRLTAYQAAFLDGPRTLYAGRRAGKTYYQAVLGRRVELAGGRVLHLYPPVDGVMPALDTVEKFCRATGLDYARIDKAARAMPAFPRDEWRGATVSL